MAVYGELLFAENFITGAVIILLTGKVTGMESPGRRVVLGALLCGLYSFVLLVPIHWLTGAMCKGAFAALVVLIVFRPETVRSWAKAIVAFFVISFLMGGVTIALMYMTGIPGMAANGSVYLPQIRYLQITAGTAASWLLGKQLAVIIKERTAREDAIHQVEISVNGREITMKGLIDTGNSLTEPVTGFPVAVICHSQGLFLEDDPVQRKRFCVIPYKTIGETGVMYGVRPDWIRIGGRTTEKAVLAVSKKDFSPWRGSEKYEILLHPQLFEGED